MKLLLLLLLLPPFHNLLFSPLNLTLGYFPHFSIPQPFPPQFRFIQFPLDFFSLGPWDIFWVNRVPGVLHSGPEPVLVVRGVSDRLESSIWKQHVVAAGHLTGCITLLLVAVLEAVQVVHFVAVGIRYGFKVGLES